MAAIVGDGMLRVSWVTTISNTSAPTTSELNAGVALETFITPDGWKVATSEAEVDNSSIASTDDTRLPGRRQDDIEATFLHQGDGNAPYTTFASKPAGYLVERTGVAQTTAYATSQKLRIFPVTAGNRNKMPRTPNEVEKFAVKFYKSAAVVDQATIA